MKKIFLLVLVLASCSKPQVKQAPANEPTIIVQTCIDSLFKENDFLYRKIAKEDSVYNTHFSKDLAYKIIFERTKYLPDTVKLKWGNSPINYRKIPDSAAYVHPELIDTSKLSRVIRLDSLSYNSNNATLVLHWLTSNIHYDYYLTRLKGKWIIKKRVHWVTGD